MDSVKNLCNLLGIPYGYHHTITFDFKKNQILGWRNPVFGERNGEIIGYVSDKTTSGFRVSKYPVTGNADIPE